MSGTEADRVQPRPESPPLRALLVGIDAYPQGAIADGAEIQPLRGCVRDVLEVRRFLLRQGVPASHVRLLTAPAVGADGRSSAAPLPTKENLVAAVRALLAACQPGEQALIHYSGHGTWLQTAFPELEKDHGPYDAALVPWDATQPGQPLLRDLELAHLLRDFVDRGVFVTLVLDGCHSGGLGFRDDVRPQDGQRLAESLRGTSRPVGDAVASVDELRDTWRWWCQPPDPRRTWIPNWQTGDSGWLPIPRGYALLAACRADQVASEIEVADGGHQGLLTHLLLGALESGGPGLTYAELHRRVEAAALALGKPQSPQREGEVERQVLGGFLRPASAVIRTLRRDGHRLLLDAGAVQGLRPQARLRLLDDEPAADRLPAERSAEARGPAVLAQVVAVQADRSWAEPMDAGGPLAASGAATPGRTPVPHPLPRWVLEDPGDDDLRAAVGLRRDGVAGAALAALDAVGRAAAGAADPFLRPAGVGEPADLQVVVAADGCFQICDAQGVEMPLRPRLAATHGEVRALVERLAHWARFRNVERLRNPVEQAELAGRVELDAALVAADADATAAAPRTVPLPRRDGVYQVRVGQPVCLTLRNHSRRNLYCAVLDLRPDRSVKVIFPPPTGKTGYEIEKGPRQPTQRHLVIRAGLPDGYDEGRDVLKLMACVRPTDFRWLQLPCLDAGPLRSAPVDRPRDPLEALFVRWVSDPLRGADDGVPVADEWTTVQIETFITRR